MNLNINSDSIIVCRGTDQEVPAKNNPENCPILCLSSVRPPWDMITLHNKNEVSTLKHLGSNGPSMGKRVVSRTLKTIHWLVLWVERKKEDIDNLTYFWNGCTNSRLHIFTDTSAEDVHRGISARWGNVKTYLCDRKMPCSTYQAHDISKDRTSSRSLRSLSQKADIERKLCENGQILSLDSFNYSVAVDAVSSTNHQLFVANRIFLKLFHGSMETLAGSTLKNNFCFDLFGTKVFRMFQSRKRAAEKTQKTWTMPNCQPS